MAAASIFRRSADESITYLRSLFPVNSILSRRKGIQPSLVNWRICDRIIDKLNLLAYKKTTIIDMNPGLGIFSAALHERLRPKQHILLEPEEVYGDRMREFQKMYKNSWHIPLDGYDWNTYDELFSDDAPPPSWPDGFRKPIIQTTPSLDEVNPDLLFVGCIGKSVKSERLLAQFVSCCALRSWIQRYGRVRFLLWVPDSIKDKYLPRSIAARARPAVASEAVADIIEVASSNEIRQGRGFHKLPVINLDNVEEEEKKPAPSKRQERKLVIKRKLVEDEIKKLAAELGPPKPPRTRGRPRKLPDEQQQEFDEATAKARKIVEAIRDGKKPKLPARLPSEERVRILNRCDEIRKIFGHKTAAEIAAEEIAEKERKRKRKLRAPRSPGRPRKLPRQQDESATIAQLTAIERRILDNPELWAQGMEHPPWYYKRNKRELRKLAAEMATIHPALGIDAGEALQPENVHRTILEATTAEGPSTTDKVDSMGKEGDESAAGAWEEYEEQWSRRCEVKARSQSRDDEIYAVHNKLLKIYNRPFEPLPINPAGDFCPHIPMTLLEITPKIPHPFFSPPTAQERESNWLTFEWLVRHLFVLRANSVTSALRGLAPGAENILAILPAHQAIPPSKRVRCLETDELVNLTMAWNRWPFKDLCIQFQNPEKDSRVARGLQIQKEGEYGTG